MPHVLLGQTRRPVPDHPARQRIVAAIAASPGIAPQALTEQLACQRSTVRHHVHRLVAAGVVRAVAVSRRVHLFVGASMDARHQDALAVLQRGRTWDLVREVARDPGQPQRELTARLGISRKLLRKYVGRLLELGLVAEVRQPPYVVYYPTDALQPFLADAELAELVA